MSDAEKRPVKPNLNWKDLSAFFIWLEWEMEWIVYGLSKLAVFKILEYAAKLTILIALILYFYEAPQRKRQSELNAWQIVNSAMNQRAASGRVEALEYLNNAKVDLSFLDVHNAYLVGTTKEGGTRGINLTGAKLYRANFAESTLRGAIFRNAYLYNANLAGANLELANLELADLTGANLSEAYLVGANLTGAGLTGANLSEADLVAANLTGARLWNADLSGAKLRAANLEGAALWGANLEGAGLWGAKLLENKNLTTEQLCKAKTLYLAKLGSELLVKVKKECPELLKKPKSVE